MDVSMELAKGDGETVMDGWARCIWEAYGSMVCIFRLGRRYEGSEKGGQASALAPGVSFLLEVRFFRNVET